MIDSRTTLVSLISSAHRVTRIAAQTTGDQTSPAVWRTLAILQNDGPMRLGELAQASRVAQPTMTKLVQNLASEDLVRRIADVEDARAWLIATTAKGERALQEWKVRLADAAAPFFAGLSDEEWRSLAAAAAVVEQRISETAVAA